MSEVEETEQHHTRRYARNLQFGELSLNLMKIKVVSVVAAAAVFLVGCGGQQYARMNREKRQSTMNIHFQMGEYQDVEFTREPPVAYLDGVVLPAASIDWEAVNGVAAQTKPSRLAWPQPRKLARPVELRLDIPAQPLEVVVRQFESVGENGFPSVMPNLWSCSRLRSPGCGFRFDGRSQSMVVPDSLFMAGSGAWYTIQVFWDVSCPKRHPDYEDRASATVVWLFTRED